MEVDKPMEDSDESDDEETTAADEADLTVIVEDADADENITIESNKSICSSRDDCSSSVDFYEVRYRQIYPFGSMFCSPGVGTDRDGPHQHSGIGPRF